MLSLFGCGDDHPSFPILQCRFTTPDHLKPRRYTMNFFFVQELGIFVRFHQHLQLFPTIYVLTAREISVPCVVFFSSKSSSYVCSYMKMTGFKSYLKFSPHLPRLSSSLLIKTPFLSLMDLARFTCLPCRRRAVCQNI